MPGSSTTLRHTIGRMPYRSSRLHHQRLKKTSTPSYCPPRIKTPPASSRWGSFCVWVITGCGRRRRRWHRRCRSRGEVSKEYCKGRLDDAKWGWAGRRVAGVDRRAIPASAVPAVESPGGPWDIYHLGAKVVGPRSVAVRSLLGTDGPHQMRSEERR